MSDRALRRVAVAVWLSTIAATVATLAIRVISAVPPIENRFGLGDAAIIAFSVLQIVFVTVGGIVLVRLPRHVVGWLLLFTGTCYGASLLATAIAFVAVTDPVSGILIARWAGWIAFVSSTASGAALTVIAFLFPDGHLASPAVARALRLLIGPAIVGMVLLALQPGPMFLITTLDNPIGIGPDVMGALGASGPLVLGAALGAVTAVSPISVALRFHRSRGVERLQLKWFVASATLAVVSLIVTGWIGFATNPRPTGEGRPLIVFALAATSMPIAIGIAILRYRLYAIDHIVKRTLVYGGASAVLGIAYSVGVLASQGPLGALTNGEAIGVAASTLTVAALFQPVRRRIQRFVDRRFYRDQYDATRAVAALGARFRDEVDTDHLGDELRTIIAGTVAPASIGVWLRKR